MFGLALARVNDSKREAVLRVVEGIAEAMRRLVAWILGLAPIGVFALAVPLASRLGFDVTLTPSQLASVVFAVVLASFAVPGIPGGSVIAMVPVLAVANLPLEGVGILLAVDTIPDMFRTTANLTGAMTLTAILPAPQD
jgi:Na+/H+-dicarboxylate symporter